MVGSFQSDQLDSKCRDFLSIETHLHSLVILTFSVLFWMHPQYD